MKKLLLITLGAAVFAALETEANVVSATPFADNMVLQRERAVPVWGTADAGERVTVSFAGQTKTATADAAGKWSVSLDPMPASKENRVLRIAGKDNAEEIKNVLVGEVWFASGQSNMNFSIWGGSPRGRDKDGAYLTSVTRRPFIRFVKTPRNASPDAPHLNWKAVWRDFSPESFKASRYNLGAVAFHYALELNGALDIPIGIVDSSWGGTYLSPWTPPSGFKGRAPVHHGGKPVVRASSLWNGMVAAYAPMAMRGFIWYQGESEGMTGTDGRYCEEMHGLYDGWAKEFRNPDLKLYFAQLAPWKRSWFKTHLEQARFAAEEKNAAMSVLCDVGNPDDIHPNNKGIVARRLALHALKRDYGFSDIVDDSPTLKSCKVEGSRFILSFDNASAWYFYNADYSAPKGFEVAGADGKFHPAKVLNEEHRGSMKGADLIVGSENVPSPKRVRYLYSKPWIGSLYSMDSGLPLGSFEAAIADNAAVKPVEVRVRQTPQGPRIFVDGKAVRPRFYYGSPPCLCPISNVEKHVYTIPFRPDVDTDKGRVSLDGFNDDAPIWFSKAALIDKTDNTTVHLSSDGEERTRHFVRDGLRLKKGHLYHFVVTHRSTHHRTYFTHEASYTDSAGRKVVMPLPYGDTLGDTVRLAAGAQVDFVTFSTDTSWGCMNWWAPPGEPPAYGRIDREFEHIISANPNALIVPRVCADAPGWMLERDPSLRMVFDKGYPVRMSSVSARPYRKAACEEVERLTRHLRAKFPRNFAGLHVSGQNSAEWFYMMSQSGELSGYDVHTRDAFRAWLLKKGEKDAATAEVPTPEARRVKRPQGHLDPVLDRRVIQFGEFRQEEMASLLCDLGAAVRRGSDGGSLAIFFYGYTWELGAVVPGAAETGHFFVDWIMRHGKGCIDGFSAPFSYSDRGWPGSSPVMAPSETFMRNGFLWINEDDYRTHLEDLWSFPVNVGQRNTSPFITRNALLRNGALNILRGHGDWWMDLCGRGWFRDAEMWNIRKALNVLDDAMMRRKKPYSPEIALVVDEKSLMRNGFGARSEVAPQLAHARFRVTLCGATHGQYLLDDVLANPPDCKLLFIAYARDLEPTRRARLEEIKRTHPQMRVVEAATKYDVVTEKIVEHAKAAGVHFYTPPLKATVCAAEGYVVVQAREEGPLEIDFGEETPVTDALTGMQIGVGPKVTLPFQKGETKIFHFDRTKSMVTLAQEPAWPEITSTMRPWCYNWWMGSAVDAAGLELQAKQLADAGLGGIHVVPIYEAIDEKHHAVDYLSDEWMRLFSVAKAKGSAHGLGTDMTTGCGWNFGGPHVPRRLGVWNLRALGPDDAPLAGGKVLWRGKDADGREVRLEAAPTGRQVDKAPKSWKGVMIDPCSKEAMRAFLEPFDRAFARPGSARPRCFYHDSYAYHETTWSPELPAAFRRLRGYALEDHYAELAGIGDADAVARVKHDYRETISDMIVENFAGWTAWAHGLGAKTRNQAHGAPANLLDFYAAADIPETEMFNTARNILMSKFASSSAHVKGGGLVSAESCTWIDEHFCATLAESKRFIDQLFLSGVDHVFYHGCCYSPPGAAWPGWCFYATLEMNPRNPIWRDARTLSDWVARYQSIAQTSEPDEDVLLYWPIHDAWRKADGFAEQFVLLQAGGWLMRSELGNAARRLYDAGVSFDYISDRQLLDLPPFGKTHYKTIVVPPCKTIPIATARRLSELARSGYKVVCVGERPSDVPGFIRPADRDAVRKAMAGVGDARIDDVGRREPFAGRSGLAYRRMRRGEDVVYYIVNQTAKRVSGAFRPSAAMASAWTLDPMDGAIRPAKTSAGAVELELEGSGSVLLWCSPVGTAGTGEERAPQVCGEPVEIKGPWTLRRVCGGPEAAWKDRTMPTLSSWATNDDGSENPFCGTVLYKTSFVCADCTGDAVLDLGKVCHSARVRLNGRDLGTRIMAPYRLRIPSGVLAKGENVLEVEVTGTGSNRLRDLDKRKVNWRVFKHPGILGRNYKPFDAAERPLAPAGLLGPVTLTLVQPPRRDAPVPVTYVMVCCHGADKGTRFLANGEWDARHDYRDYAFARDMMRKIKEAGINVVGVDFTNPSQWDQFKAHHWPMLQNVVRAARELDMQYFLFLGNTCANGMKYWNEKARIVWEEFAQDPHYRKYGFGDDRPMMTIFLPGKVFAEHLNRSKPEERNWLEKFRIGTCQVNDPIVPTPTDGWGYRNMSAGSTDLARFVAPNSGVAPKEWARVDANEWRRRVKWALGAKEYAVIGTYDDTCDCIFWGIADVRKSQNRVHIHESTQNDPHAYYNIVVEELNRKAP